MARVDTQLRLVPIVVALIAIFLAGSVQAQQPDYSASGPYVGIGFGIGFENFDDDGMDLDIDPAYGFDAWGGYRFHPNFAGEFQIEYLNGFEVDNIDPFEVKAQLVTFTANAKGYLLTGRWQPFALVGVGMCWQEAWDDFTGESVDETAFAARFGGGIDFYLTESIALNVNSAYVLPTGDLDGGDYISLVVGAQFRF